MSDGSKSTSPSVVIAFADPTLGGTSRAALTAASAWARAGYRVTFVPLVPPHPERAREMKKHGEVRLRTSLHALQPPTLVHLHHAAWNDEMREQATSLIVTATRLGWSAPLLTNNIFAVDDRLLEAWPARRATGVLGRWALEQYRRSWPSRRAHSSVVIPNAQDTEFFHPPTPEQSAEARARLGLDLDAHVIVRVGSPFDDKWSASYEALASALGEGDRLVLVGAPASLTSALRLAPRVVVADSTSDSRRVRDYYWAADVLALDAVRGESFGNVLVEAMATGLPAVYRAHPLRDNTPWEFRNISGFTYSTRDAEWIAQALTKNPERADHEAVADRYGIAAASALLGSAAEALTHRRHLKVRSGLGVADRLQVLVRHNPVTTMIKQRRLRGR